MNAKFKTMVVALAIIAGACGSDSKSGSNSVSQKENQKKHQQELNKAKFEITKAKAEDLAFTKLTEILSAGETLQASEILVNVKGVKAGYTLKQIKNLSNTGVARIEANQKAIALKKAGSFTATLVLEHNTKADATITNAQFEILPADTIVLRFQKLIKDFSAGGSFSTQEILANVQGAKTGYTLKTIRLNGNASEIVSVAGTKPNLSLNFKKSGIFTATLVLEHNTKADATIIKSAFVANLNIKDPLYKDQWYLKNTGQYKGTPGIDINVEPVWKQGFWGQGIFVGILDDVVQKNHPDLKDNLPSENVIDYVNLPICDPTNSVGSNGKRDKDTRHGTGVAGLIAARDNNIGVRGVAFRSTLYSYGITTDDNDSSMQQRDRNLTSALKRPEHKKIAVYNGSIGVAPDRYSAITPELYQAIEQVLQKGFDGKGSSLVFAAGNSHLLRFGNASTEMWLSSHYAVIVINTMTHDGVSAINAGGNGGVSLWLASPSVLAFSGAKMFTTPVHCGSNPQSYNNTFSATSGATPLVTGVIALLRQAYPQLTWRDVKLILAESARKITQQGQVYETTGKMYSNPSQDQKYHRYTGFGLVDAGAALQLAKTWKLLPEPMKVVSATQNTPLDTQKKDQFHESVLSVNAQGLSFIESVTLEMEVGKSQEKEILIDQWDLVLVAPNGKESYFFKANGKTMVSHVYDDSLTLEKGTNQVRFVSNSFLGSANIQGQWRLKIKKYNSKSRWSLPNQYITQIKNWKLTIRGH